MRKKLKAFYVASPGIRLDSNCIYATFESAVFAAGKHIDNGCGDDAEGRFIVQIVGRVEKAPVPKRVVRYSA